MAWHDWGNPTVASTQTSTTGQSTTALLAAISSASISGGIWSVRWVVGGSTNATWELEHALSTGLGSTAIRDVMTVFTPPNQSAEYVRTYVCETGDIFRAMITSTVAIVAAKIEAEKLT